LRYCGRFVGVAVDGEVGVRVLITGANGHESAGFASIPARDCAPAAAQDSIVPVDPEPGGGPTPERAWRVPGGPERSLPPGLEPASERCPALRQRADRAGSAARAARAGSARRRAHNPSGPHRDVINPQEDPCPLYAGRDMQDRLASLTAEARALAQELLPRLEPPGRGPREARRRARAYGTAARNYLHNLSLARRGREDLRPLYFIWTTQRACNFACVYCDDHRGRRYPDLPDDGVLDTNAGLRLLRIMRTGTPSVYFAGGEPTLRPDLPRLTREARDLDYFPILINTNGSAVDRLLRLEAWRTWLADTDVVIVSLDALDIAVLETMWGYRRPDQVVRNILLLRELAGPMRFKLMVNTVIQPGMARHARAVLDFAEAHRLWFCPVPLNVGPRVDRSLLDDPEYRGLARHILERKRAGALISGTARLNRRLLFGEPLTCRNTLKPHVDFDGRLYWPCKASVHVEPERIDVLRFQSVEELYRHAVGRIDPTCFHGPADNQCGASCNWAQNYTTDAYAHGLTHPTTLLGEVWGLLRRAA